MAKRRQPSFIPPPPSPATSQGGHHLLTPAAVRETVESIVIALILAFLFRTFEAEAFVIPTGSMAPTLMGRHKDLACPKCGSPYQLSASDEVTQDGSPLGVEKLVEEGTCPMCRYTADLGPNNPQHKKYPSYYGDRVLVGKFSYKFHEPRRWDVIVFRYPNEAAINYIKRLVGLPGETIRIRNGDIWTSREQGLFQIARKPPEKLLAMLQPVFDNDYMPQIASCGWPTRWQSESQADANATGTWQSQDPAEFSTDGTAAAPTWLRYRHRIPSYHQWSMVQDGMPIRQAEPKPQLITDFTAYDTGRSRYDVADHRAPNLETLGLHWVGDLALACTIDAQSDAGELLFELCKGGRKFHCRLNLDSGRATLAISGADMESFHPAATTTCTKGRHNILFSNCDDELRLWVDEKPVVFDAPTTYDDLGNSEPDDNDLSPVGVASIAAKVKLSHIRILRDIYYIAAREHSPSISDYADPFPIPREITDFIRSRPRRNTVEFVLKPDQFFMLGDNSARSKDGRLWGPEHWVNRDLLIGQALLVYWPHSWNKIHTPWFDIPCPYFPNFQRMGLVR